jgi:hypothetical protein
MLVNGERRPRRMRMTPEDELPRERLYPQAHRSPSARRIALLSALAALLVLVIAGTTALVVRDLRLSQAARTSTRLLRQQPHPTASLRLT